MKKSKLKNIANKSGKNEYKKRYKIQRNVVTKLNKKLKKVYFKEKLPKGKDVEYILKVLRKDSKILDTFNYYFVNIIDKLGIYKWVISLKIV